MHLSCPAHSAHDLIEYQQHSVFVANLSNRLEVSRNRCKIARCRSSDWGFSIIIGSSILTCLCEECRHFPFTHTQYLPFQLIGQPLSIIIVRLAVVLVSVGVTRRDSRGVLHQDWFKVPTSALQRQPMLQDQCRISPVYPSRRHSRCCSHGTSCFG